MSSLVPRYVRANQNVCVYNTYVDCSEHDKCEVCGWNQKVSDARLRAIKKDLEVFENSLYNGRHAR